MELLGFASNLQPFAILCLLLGLGFVIFEMFHPGFGAPGIIGGVLLVAGILLTARSVLDALMMIIIILAILGLALTYVLRSATKGHLAKHLVLNDESEFINSNELEYFLGKEGTALTILRPSGTADFDGVKLDVVSDGEFIAKDSKVKVIKVIGRKIIVKEILQGR